MPPIFKVLKQRHFRNLWLSQVLSQIASNMLLFILVIRVYQITQSNVAVSGMVFLFALPALALGIPAGIFTERYDKRRVLFFCNLLRSFLLLTLFLLPPKLPLLYLGALSAAFISQFFIPAEGPTIPRVVPKRLLLSANSLFSFTITSSLILGFVLGGSFLRLLGPQRVFLFLFFLFFLAAFFVRRIPPERNKKNTLFLPLGEVKKEFLEGLAFIKAKKEISSSLFLLAACQGGAVLAGSWVPGFAHQVLRISPEDASLWVVGPAILGMLLGAVNVGSFGERFSRQALVNTGIFGAGVILLALATLAHVKGSILPLSFLLTFLLGINFAFIVVPLNTLIQEHTQANFRGRVYGVLLTLFGVAGVFPLLVAGFLADILGTEKLMAFFALAILGYAGRRWYNTTKLKVKS